VSELVSFILHIDTYLEVLFQQFGVLSYGAIFLVIFCETGLVVTPFLPGDSLLFAVGTLGGSHILNIALGWTVLFLGSILGDSSNYWIGRKTGRKILEKYKPISDEHIEQTNKYFARFGAATIAIGRFAPFVRTFAPFIAGVSTMPYPTFLRWSILGSLGWVSLFTGAGYLFGNIPLVRDNFSLVIMLLILASLVPTGIHALRTRNVSK